MNKPNNRGYNLNNSHVASSLACPPEGKFGTLRAALGRRCPRVPSAVSGEFLFLSKLVSRIVTIAFANWILNVACVGPSQAFAKKVRGCWLIQGVVPKGLPRVRRSGGPGITATLPELGLFTGLAHWRRAAGKVGICQPKPLWLAFSSAGT